MSRSVSVHDRTLQLQKKIFQSLKAESYGLMGKTPASILQYERENRSDFRLKTPMNEASKSELIETVRNSDVTFIADFHTFDQAQRTALRIIRESIAPSQSSTSVPALNSWMIGLELVPSEFQKALDTFQKEELSLTAFQDAISYREEWGFPWKNYEPLFQWAKENQIRLIALNRPKSLIPQTEARELHDRDQWAAGIITDLFFDQIQKGSRPKMIVLYGELHVGSKHLPYQLKKISQSFLKFPLSSTTIHQNQDELFWQLAEQNLELKTEVIQLKKGVFCVLSSTPWAKLQSLINWAEGESSDKMDNEQDYLSIIQTYGHTLSEFLNLSPPDYQALSVCTYEHADLIEAQIQKAPFSKKEMGLIRFYIQNNQRFFIPKIAVAYLGSPSQNGAAELAAIHLLRNRNSSDHLFQPGLDDFYRRVLEATFGFFGSLIINPRRKCDLPKDHIHRLLKLKKEAPPTFMFEYEARRIALGTLRNRAYPKLDLPSVTSTTKLAPASMMGARFLGQILGTTLHQMVLAEKVEGTWIHDTFLTASDSSPNFFENRYKTLEKTLDQISSKPSKMDRF